jgi:hypothetical protein
MGKENEKALGLILDLPLGSGEEVIPDPHSAGRRVGRGLVDDGAGAAEVDVAVIGDELEGRRRDVDGQILLHHGLIALEEPPQRPVAGGDPQDRGPFLEAGDLGCGHRELLFLHRLGVLLAGQVVLRAARSQRRGHGLESYALVGDGDLQGRGSQHVAVRRERDLRCVALEARREVVGAGGKPDDDGQQEKRNGREPARFFRIECVHA